MKKRRRWIDGWPFWALAVFLLMGSAEAFGGTLFPLIYVLFIAWFLWRSDRDTGRGDRDIRLSVRKRQPK